MKLLPWTIDVPKDYDIPLSYVLINNHLVFSYLHELIELDFFMPMGVSEHVIWHLTSSRCGPKKAELSMEKGLLQTGRKEKISITKPLGADGRAGPIDQLIKPLGACGRAEEPKS